MKKIYCKKIIFIIIFLQTGIFINAYEKARSYNKQISFIFGLSDKFAVSAIGNINYSDNAYTLYKITYNNANATNNRRYLFISCVHGNETATVYAIKDFILYLDSQERVIDNITVDFVYILNPYGFEHNTRYNGQGTDLNRDFISFESPEITLLMNSVKNTRYDGMYDFHEHSAAAGFFLYYYDKRNEPAAKTILNMMRSNNIELENQYTDVILKAKDGAIMVPFYAKWYFMGIKKQATTGLYFDKMNVNEVFIIETPVHKSMETRKKAIGLVLKYITEKQ